MYVRVLVRVLRIAGFITIDCGLSGETGWVDDTTKLSFVPDAGFIDTGSNHNISPEFVKAPLLAKTWYTVRSFAGAGVRNCYTLRSLVSGIKYIVRAKFGYGNYDRLDSPPVFDLYVGVNYWSTVNISGPEVAMIVEAIVVVPDDFVQVCLVNTGAGTPFISGLDLRPLKRTLYPQVTAARGLDLMTRLNFGTTNESLVIRYPDDPHDRIWHPMVDTVTWASISTTQQVQFIDKDLFEAPSAVLRTAIMPRNVSQNIELTWFSQPTPTDPSPGYIIILHFAEVTVLPGNALRQLSIILNGRPWYTFDITPTYLFDIPAYHIPPFQYSQFNLSVW
jgi:hypothetical protein